MMERDGKLMRWMKGLRYKTKPVIAWKRAREKKKKENKKKRGAE